VSYHITAGAGVVQLDIDHPLRLGLKETEALVIALLQARNQTWLDQPELVLITSAARQRERAWYGGTPVVVDEDQPPQEAG